MKQFESHSPKTNNDQPPIRKRVVKTYNQARKHGPVTYQRINKVVEGTYFNIIDRVKQPYSTLPNPKDRIIVEMDRTEECWNPMGIYSFLTPHFYFYMECSVLLKYRVEYQLFNCPFEKEIEDLLKTTILRSYSIEVMKMPNYPDFFAEVIRVQPDKFKCIL